MPQTLSLRTGPPPPPPVRTLFSLTFIHRCALSGHVDIGHSTLHGLSCGDLLVGGIFGIQQGPGLQARVRQRNVILRLMRTQSRALRRLRCAEHDKSCTAQQICCSSKNCVLRARPQLLLIHNNTTHSSPLSRPSSGAWSQRKTGGVCCCWCAWFLLMPTSLISLSQLS